MRKNRAGGITLLAFRLYYNATVWRRQWQPTPVLLPGKSHGQRGLVGCSPWGREELDTTERLHFHFSLSCTGEGNGNPLQCSCLENPRDGEPGGLPSMGSHRVGYDWSDLAAAQCYNHQNKTVLTQKQTHRSIKQERKPRNETTHLWSSNPLQRRQE